jgi:hypothetical protein
VLPIFPVSPAYLDLCSLFVSCQFILFRQIYQCFAVLLSFFSSCFLAFPVLTFLPALILTLPAVLYLQPTQGCCTFISIHYNLFYCVTDHFS